MRMMNDQKRIVSVMLILTALAARKNDSVEMSGESSVTVHASHGRRNDFAATQYPSSGGTGGSEFSPEETVAKTQMRKISLKGIFQYARTLALLSTQCLLLLFV